MKNTNLSYEARFLAYKIELERNPTNRRKDVISSELHRLASEISEHEKNKINNIKLKHKSDLEDLKSDYEEQINNIQNKLNLVNKEIATLKEKNNMNKLKAQNVFKKLNARLTPSEFDLFKDGLAFIRLFV